MNEISRPHVIIVGGGLAGLSATIEALEAGVRVTLIDKTKLGGNSAKATSGINGASSKTQIETGIKNDSIELFLKDILKSGQNKNNINLAHTLAAKSADTVSFLETKLGKSLDNVVILGGHSVARTHQLPIGPKVAPIGFTSVMAFKQFINQDRWKNQLKILEGFKVIDFIIDDTNNIIKGVVITENQLSKQTLLADSVVLTAGGFSANFELVQKQNSLAKNCPFTTNGPFATGDILQLSQKYNFGTIDLDQIQLHPTGFVNPENPLASEKFLCPEYIRGSGAILIDKNGQRFVNELEKRDIVSTAIKDYGSRPFVWGIGTKDDYIPSEKKMSEMALLVMNDQVKDKIGNAVFDFYKSKNLIKEYGNLLEFSKHFNFNPELFQKTIRQYNEAASNLTKDLFGKIIFPVIFDFEKDNFYASYVTPAIHYTMGGLKINTETQVLTNDNQNPIIINLFAAGKTKNKKLFSGEIAGGVHGSNRLGGNGMLESILFGRIAGENAAQVR